MNSFGVAVVSLESRWCLGAYKNLHSGEPILVLNGDVTDYGDTLTVCVPTGNDYEDEYVKVS